MSDWSLFKDARPRSYQCGTCHQTRRCATRGPLPLICTLCQKAALPNRRFANGRTEGTAGSAIIDALSQFGPLTATELRHRLPSFRDCTIKTAAMRMVRHGMLTRSTVLVGQRPTFQYAIGAVEYSERAPIERIPEAADEPWAPGKWVHPHLLKQQRRPELEPLPLDFADPRRRAA